MAASAPAPVVVASAPAASAPSAPGSGAVSCGGGAACGGGGWAGGSSGGGSASASPAPAAPAAPEEPSADPSQPSDPTEPEDEDNEDKPDSTDPGSEDTSLPLPEDSAATPAAASVPARARLFSLPVKMLGATAATYAASEESGVSATADTDTPPTWEYGWNSETKSVQYSTDGGAKWNDVEYTKTETTTTSNAAYSITPDGDGNYTNTVFNLSNRPSLIQAVDADGNVNEDAHVSIKLMAASSGASDGKIYTDFKGVDTVHVAYNEEAKSALRLRMNNSSAFLCATDAMSNSLFVSGGQLWLDGSSSPTTQFTVRATLYLGGSSPKYPADAKYGLDCDVRAQGLIRFERTINLIGNASIVGLVSTDQSTSLKGDEKVEFLYTSCLYGNNYDLTFSGANLGALGTGYKNSPFKLRAGSRFENVKSLIIGGIGDTYGATVLDIMAPDTKSSKNPYLGVGSLRVGQGSVVNVADGVTHLYFSGKDSAADYDKTSGLGDYSVLLLNDASKGASVMNVAEKASISCNTDNMKHSDGTVIGQVTGAFAVDVASDGTLSISGGTAAETEGYDTPKTIATGKVGDNCSTLENLKLDIKDGASLVLNDIILGKYHAVKGADSASPNSLKLNNVTIGLANNYTTQSVATLAEGGPLNLKATGGGAGTLTIDDTASILTINYGGMENLTFADDGTLVLDFANMGLKLGEYKYVAVVFDETVNINPEKVTVTGISGPLDNTGYYLPVADGGSTNVVYFLVPEPASGLLCLFGLAAGAARRRRKQK